MFNRIVSHSSISRSLLRPCMQSNQVVLMHPKKNFTSTTIQSSSTASSFLSKLTGSSSSPSSSSSSSPPTDQYAKQIYDMAQNQIWTMNHFSDQIKSMTGGWKTKLPFINSSDQVKQMKRMQDLVDATMDVLGSDVNLETLKGIGKKEKLMICLKCDADLQDVNGLITQFESTDMMHRLLRYRLEQGKPIPQSEDESKKMMQEDLKKVLTKDEFREMRHKRMKAMR